MDEELKKEVEELIKARVDAKVAELASVVDEQRKDIDEMKSKVPKEDEECDEYEEEVGF